MLSSRILTRRVVLLVAAVICFAIAAAIPLIAEAVTAAKYDLPIVSSVGGSLGVDSSGKLWTPPVVLSSSGPNALLALDPASNQLTVWSHQRPDVFQPAGPLVSVDAQDRVWFYGGQANGQNLISRLDPSGGQVVGWPTTYLYGFASDPQGRLWLNLGTQVGLLDPSTNVLTTWSAQYATGGVASDALGRGWFIEQTENVCPGCLNHQAIVMIDPAANTQTTWALPAPPLQFGQGAIMQGSSIAIDASGAAWVTVIFETQSYEQYHAGSGVVILNPATNEMRIWPCPTGCATLTSISVGPQGKAWLTESPNICNRSCNPNFAYAKIARLDLQANPILFIEYSAHDIVSECGNDVAPATTIADHTGRGWTTYYDFYSNPACSYNKITMLPP